MTTIINTFHSLCWSTGLFLWAFTFLIVFIVLVKKIYEVLYKRFALIQALTDLLRLPYDYYRIQKMNKIQLNFLSSKIQNSKGLTAPLIGRWVKDQILKLETNK